MKCEIETNGWIDPLSDIERSIRELRPGQHVALRLHADKADWDIDFGQIEGRLDLVDASGVVYQRAYSLPPLLINIVLGTVLSVSKDRIRVLPYDEAERHSRLKRVRSTHTTGRFLDLSIDRTGEDLAYVGAYSLDFGKPTEH